MEKSDTHVQMNGFGENEKNSVSEISKCTITNKITEDLAHSTDKFSCKPSPKAAGQSPTSNEINIEEENNKFDCKFSPKAELQTPVSIEIDNVQGESLGENGLITNKAGMCVVSIDNSENFIMEPTSVSDCANEKIATCDESLTENVYVEGKLNSNSSISVKNCSENASSICTSVAEANECAISSENDICASGAEKNIHSSAVESVNCASAAESNIRVAIETEYNLCDSAADSICQSNSDTLVESIPVKSDVPETLNAKSEVEILKTESRSSISETVEAFDESVSEEEIYEEVEGIDEQDSDFSIDKPEECQVEEERDDQKSSSICNDAPDSLKINDLLNDEKHPIREPDSKMSNDFLNESNCNLDVSMIDESLARENADEGISEKEAFSKMDNLSEKVSNNLKISNKKEDDLLLEKNPEMVTCMNFDIENVQTESKASTSVDDVQCKNEEKLSENDIEMSEISDGKSLESNIAVENNSSDYVDLLKKEKLSENDCEMSETSNMSSLESNIAIEETSPENVDKEKTQNDSDMSKISNVKSLESNSADEKNSPEHLDMEMANLCENDIEMPEMSGLKSLESNITDEKNSPEHVDMEKKASLCENDMKMSETSGVKSLESNIKDEKNSPEHVDMEKKENMCQNDSEMSKTADVKTLESNIGNEKNSPEHVGMEKKDNDSKMSETFDVKSLESNVADKKKSPEHVAMKEKKKMCENDIEISEASEVKSFESNIAVEINTPENVAMEIKKNLSENDNEISKISDGKALESNIGDEKNSPKHVVDMETSKNEKTNETDDFLILSDIEWSDDDDTAEKNKNKVEEQTGEKEKVQNKQECSDKKECQEDTMKENPGASSDGDDFDLDDVIEEFAKEENKIVKLSDDELDDLVEEFVEAECSISTTAEKNKKTESKDLPSESDDEMELLIEDFKAVDSDNDCFIVQDSSNVVIVNDQPKRKRSKSNDSQSCSTKNSTDNKVKCTNEKAESGTENNSIGNNSIAIKDTNIEKNKSVPFNNEVAENKQTKNSQLFEFLHKNKNEGIRKAEISIASLPLSEKLTGEKVTVECRTDGVFLVQNPTPDDNPTTLQATNENGEDINDQKINMVVTNNTSSSSDQLSVEQSVINNANSKIIAEEQCMDAMLNEVCAADNSTNNEECESTAIGKERETANNSINLEKEQITSENGKVKSLGSLCQDNLEESKKRKLETMDNESDEPQKKIKTDIASGNIDTAHSSTTEVNESLRSRLLEHFNEAFPAKVQLKKCWLEKLTKKLCQETLTEEYKQQISEQNNLIKDLEAKLQALEEELYYYHSQAKHCVSVQQELFQKHHYTQTAVRTVAVNVKIFRECDVPQPMPSPAVTEVELPTTVINESTPVSSTPITVQVPQHKTTALPIQQSAAPQTMVTTRLMSNPVQPRAITTTSQRFVPLAPNVTMTKKELVPGLSISQGVPSRSLNAQKSLSPTKTQNQLIDLTDEGSSNKKLLSASTTLASIASSTVPKANMPGMQNNQNVLLPLNGLFQMLPASAPNNNAQFSLSNPVQVQQVARQTLVPNLPTNLIGPRTVAYIIPSNSGQISTIGRNALPMTNFVPGTNQRLQTVFVRVTNPAQVPPIGTVINSNARMPLVSQGVRTASIRNSSIPSPASDLVLLPRQQKHPAPFPALPEYRPNPQLRALPPKPSLKGSKAPNGIILSWNMSLLSLHADISNYQLFAYQETSGPVTASLWKKVGDVKALPLPMACTLTQFVYGNRYYFTVRAVDAHNRFGPYSDAVSILFSDAKDSSKSSNK